MIQDKIFVFTLSLLSISGSAVVSVSVMYLRPRYLESMMTFSVILLPFRCQRKTGTLFSKTFYPHYTIVWNSQHDGEPELHEGCTKQKSGFLCVLTTSFSFVLLLLFFFALTAQEHRVAVKWSHARSVTRLRPSRTHRAAYELLCCMCVFMYQIHFCSHVVLRWIAYWITDWKIDHSQGICV